MNKNAKFSPCRNCQYRGYDKEWPFFVLEDGGIIAWIGTDYHGIATFTPDQVNQNPCYECQAAEAYANEIDAELAHYPATAKFADLETIKQEFFAMRAARGWTMRK